MKLSSDETALVGKWTWSGDQWHPDPICDRIKWLTSNHLRKVKISSRSGAWETLFQDPDDGRYWEQTYPQGEMHGGGPPALHCLTTANAKAKYGNDLADI